jgi:hypothetical protein
MVVHEYGGHQPGFIYWVYLFDLQDCEELSEWVQEKNITAQDETYRSAKTVHSKWTRHQAFEAEIASNKDRLFRIQLVHNLFLYFHVWILL